MKIKYLCLFSTAILLIIFQFFPQKSPLFAADSESLDQEISEAKSLLELLKDDIDKLNEFLTPDAAGTSEDEKIQSKDDSRPAILPKKKAEEPSGLPEKTPAKINVKESEKDITETSRTTSGRAKGRTIPEPVQKAQEKTSQNVRNLNTVSDDPELSRARTSTPSEQSIAPAAEPISFEPSFNTPSTLTKEELSFRSNAIKLERFETVVIVAAEIRRFLVVNPKVARVEKLSPTELKIFALDLGSTVIHVWDAEGRFSIVLSVKQRGIRISQALEQKKLTELGRVESLKVRLSSDMSKTHTRSKNHNNDSEFSDYFTKVEAQGGTYFGDLFTTIALQQKDTSLLSDRDINEFIFNLKGKDYELNIGDSFANFSELTLPFTHFQGVDFWHKLDTRSDFNYVIGSTGNRLWGDNLFFGEGTRYFQGLRASHQLLENVKLNFIEVRARGVSEFPDDLHSLGSEIKAGDLLISNEFAVNDENDFSWSTTGKYDRRNLRVESIYRDYIPDFRSISTDVPHRGEKGVYTLIDYDFLENVSLAIQHDYFEQRFNPNTDRLDYFNTNFNMNTRIDLPMEMRLNVRNFYQDLKGTAAANEYFGEGVSFSKQFRDIPLVSVFADFESTKSRNERSPSSDFNNVRVTVGGQMRLAEHLFLGISEGWDFRRFIESGDQASPKSFGASLSYNAQVFDTPFHVRGRLEYGKDSGVSASRISFTGEESMVAEGEVRYTPSFDFEAYLRGRFSEFDGIIDGTLDRKESAVFAGFNYFFDTGIRLEFQGDVRGRVFRDVNSDGLFDDARDIPYHAIKINIADQIAYSDLDGTFHFPYVTPGTRTVNMNLKKFPKGTVLTTPNPQTIIVKQLETTEVLFGVTTRTMLSGFVFNDLDGDGIYTESADEGLQKVRVYLTDAFSATSNRVGYYTMTNLIAGSYKLRIDGKTFPEGLLPVFPKGVEVVIDDGGVFRKNIPMYALRAVMGTVFIDANGNGKQDSDEKGVSGVELRAGALQAKSGKNGAYIFRKLPAGDIEVAVIEDSIPRGLVPAGPRRQQITLPKTAFTQKDVNFTLKGA